MCNPLLGGWTQGGSDTWSLDRVLEHLFPGEYWTEERRVVGLRAFLWPVAKNMGSSVRRILNRLLSDDWRMICLLPNPFEILPAQRTASIVLCGAF